MKTKLVIVLLTTVPLLAQVGGGMGGGMGGFGGPAVLGRGAGSGTGQRGGADLGIGIFAGVMGTVDSGLSAFALDADGNLSGAALRGVDGFAGVFGSKQLRRGSFGINYVGHYRHYGGAFAGGFNGTDQTVSVFWSKQVSRRSMFSINASGTTTNRPFGMGFVGGPLNPFLNNAFAPNGEIFDNRIYFASGGGEYTLQKSARLSFSVAGNGFITRRSGSVLFGVNGAFATANAAYRLSRRQTLSLGYQFMHFRFTRRFGDTYGHGVFGGYSAQLGRKAQFGIQAGAMQLESLGLTQVQIDPVIAALIGVSSVSEVFYSKTWMPTLMTNFGYRVNRKHSFDASGGIMALPGNGVINTARGTMVGAGYTYSGLRDWGLSFNTNYMRMASRIGFNQVFTTYMNSFNASRRISDTIFFSASAGQRKFLNSDTNTFRRNSFFATAGITWSPQAVPVSIR